MPTLSIVATPIGNLQDITLRAIQTLKESDAILCEDTRVTMKLLARLEIKKPLVSFHEHSDRKRLEEILNLLKEGKNLALVTDAGTPAISDPGSWLVREVVDQLPDVTIVAIPGPSAVVGALSISGFYGDEFVFMGFPPHKKGRQAFFDRAAKEERIVVLYESTHRIMKAMEELTERLGERQIVVCRELTKMHETIYRGTVAEVTAKLKTGSIKGEFAIVLAAV
ncbi:MAG: 16S rRNA (cytidine(1402)-2'-O)-methyltransferase [Patescibacteria group bacterium]